jgi:uncharacterized protein YggU (UPF0235/DUF167 family)
VDAPLTRVRLRVVPGAREDAVVGRYGEAWKLRVRAAAERGAANEAVVALLARTLGVQGARVAVVSGHGGRDKIVELAGLTPAEIESRLASARTKGA